jgi:hypothetical protein
MDTFEAINAKHYRSLVCNDAGRDGIIISIPISGGGLIGTIQWADGSTAQVELVALRRKLEELR